MRGGFGLGLGKLGGLGQPAPGKGGGAGIVISAGSIAENAANGTTIGNLSVVGGVGTYTFTKTADPDSKFSLTGAALKKNAVMDYETKTSHSVTIHADNGAGSTFDRTFSIVVTNVLEVTLNALSIDDDTSVADASWSASITGKTSGSTITATSSDGTVLSVVGTTVSGIFADGGQPTITLHETHPDASPRDTAIGVTVFFNIDLENDPLDNDDDVDITTDGAGTLYWMITTNATETAAHIIAHTGAVQYGNLDTSVGVNAVPISALDGVTELYFHSVLCYLGGTTQASAVESVKIQTAAAASASYLFSGDLATNSEFKYVSGSFDLGLGAADRFVLIAATINDGGAGDPVVVANGVTLTKLSWYTPSIKCGFWGGLVASGDGSKTCSVTFTNGEYENKSMAVWVLRGLDSTTAKQLVTGSSSIAVDLGDLLFFIELLIGSTEPLDGALTETPDRSAIITAGVGNFVGFSADWVVDANHAAFDVEGETTANVKIAFR